MKPGKADSILLAILMVCIPAGWCLGQTEAVLGPGTKAVWDLDKASREKTATRERVCLNGLWRWQPAVQAGGGGESPPAGKWGYFKVPGCWPGISDYMQKDCQTVYSHPAWKDIKLRDITAAWYQREITIPADWAGRRVSLYAEYLNSYAVAYLDGKKVGELRFPAGEIDVTTACRPAGKAALHVLSLLVVAMPLKGVMLSYSDSAAAKEDKGALPIALPRRPRPAGGAAPLRRQEEH